MFWVGAFALVAFALAFLLLPMLRSASYSEETLRLRRALRALDEAEASGAISAEQAATRHEELSAELKKADPEDIKQSKPWAWVGILVIGMPLATALVYQQVGAPYALNIKGPGSAAPVAEDGSAPELEAAIAGLKAKLKSNPDDAEGWVLLGRSQMALRQHQEALAAFGRARELQPNEPVIMVDYAEALAFASGSGRLPEESRVLLESAVAVQPDNQKALWLLGMGAYQTNDFALASNYWGQLARFLEPGSSVEQQVTGLLTEARRLAGETSPPEPDPAQTPSGNQLRLAIDLAPELAPQVEPGDALFVYARLPAGPRMPLAVKRLTAGELPLEITLSDADAMTPAMTLSSTEQVVISARISKSGNAITQPGDLQVISEPVSSSRDTVLSLTIDSVVK